MAYKLIEDDISYVFQAGVEYGDLIFEDIIDWPEADQALAARSTLEFMRDQLDAGQIEAMTKIDKLWRAHPEEFNKFFRFHHARKDINTALQNWVVDNRGNTPQIPKTHWWWWSLKTK